MEADEKKTVRRQSGGNQGAIRRQSGGNQEAIRGQSGGDQWPLVAEQSVAIRSNQEAISSHHLPLVATLAALPIHRDARAAPKQTPSSARIDTPARASPSCAGMCTSLVSIMSASSGGPMPRLSPTAPAPAARSLPR